MRRMEHIGDALRGFLRAAHLDRRLAEQQLVLAWPEVVGPEIASQSEAVELRRGVLWVAAGNNVWMQHILFLKPRILATLRREFPGVAVEDLRCVLRGRRGGTRGAHEG
jgi:predicted nucleic acid-binding Zn ribbon protein